MSVPYDGGSDPGATWSIDGDLYRDRVALFLKVLFLLHLALSVISTVAPRIGPDPATNPDDLSIANGLAWGLVVSLGVAWWWMSRPATSTSARKIVESVGTVVIVSAYALMIRLAPDPLARFFILPLAGFVLSLRAAIVPSTAVRTGMVGLAAVVVTILAVLTIAERPGRNEVIWTSTLGLALAAVTVATSSVIYGLRRVARAAVRLGQYEIVRTLGEGGMGVVFEATHVLLRRRTAVKVLQPELVGAETVDRFEREVRQTSRLEHPNSIYVYDFGRTSDGQFYYAMEYLDGLDLDRLVRGHGPLPVGRVILILRQAAAALAEAHAKGLVHRDIKPANMMLCDRGGVPDTLKVLDFGLVKSLDQADSGLTQVGSVVGTPHYLAPEGLKHSQDVGPAADVYGLGASAYFLLSGRPMFDSGSVVETCARHLTEPPPDLSEHAARQLDDRLVSVIARCLHKDPGERIRYGGELWVELGRLDATDWSRDDAASWWMEYAVDRPRDGSSSARSPLEIDIGGRA